MTLADSTARGNLGPAGLAAAGANSTLMTDETRLERRLDRLIARAQNPRKAAMVIAGVTTTMTLGAGLVMTAADHDSFPTLGSGLWWAVQTVTTVGYGDHVPANTAGRILAALVMLLGIGFLTVITASITGSFVERSRRDREETGEGARHDERAAGDRRTSRADRGGAGRTAVGICREAGGFNQDGSGVISVAIEGRDDLRLSFLPVAGDGVAIDGEEGVVCDVVEVAEAEKDRGDRAVGVRRLIAGEKEGEAFLDAAARLLLDRHHVEVVAQLRATGDRVELHCEQVAEPGDGKAGDEYRGLEPTLGPIATDLKKLQPGGAKEAVERAGRVLGDGERPLGAKRFL